MGSCSTWTSLLSIVVLFFCCTVEASDEFQRQLRPEFNCSSSEDENALIIYGVKATGPNDELYHIWDSRGPFTIMILRFPLHTSLEVNCKQLLLPNFTDGLRFSNPTDYSFALVLTEVFEFDDVEDTATFPSPGISEGNKSYAFADFSWTTNLTQSDDSISLKYNLADKDNHTLGDNGIQLELSVYSNSKRPDQLPRLVHTANSTVVNFVLNDAHVRYNNSRFGVLFHMLNGNNTNPFEISINKVIDDEYTPGVFKMIQVLTQMDLSGYIQWKPTVYTSDQHKHESSTETHESKIYDNANDETALRKSIAYAVYGEDILQMNQSMTVSFGMSKDDFYKSTNYSSWTFSVGCGELPADSISTVVIIIITVGLGIPFLLLLGGVVYMLVKRYRSRQDDLLLSS